MMVRSFAPDYLSTLISDATVSRRLRQHRNIHASYEDPCQRFFNAIGADSYIRPHRHLLDPKAETMVAVRGLFALVTFNEDGTEQEFLRFGTEKYGGTDGLSVGVDLPPGTWHTVIALEPDSVLLELKAGPFDPAAAKEPAPWAPEEGSREASVYLARLKALLMKEQNR